MKEVNSYGWKAVIGSSIGYAMDGFDLLILGFMLTLISGDLGLTTGQAGSLTWTLVGPYLVVLSLVPCQINLVAFVF